MPTASVGRGGENPTPAVEEMGFVAPTAPDEEDGSGFVAPTSPDEEDGSGFVAPTSPDEEDGTGFVAPTSPSEGRDADTSGSSTDDDGDDVEPAFGAHNPTPAPTVPPEDDLAGAKGDGSHDWELVDDFQEEPTTLNDYVMEFLSSDIFFFSCFVLLFLSAIALYIKCCRASALRHPDEKAAYSQLAVFDPTDDDAIDEVELAEMK